MDKTNYCINWDSHRNHIWKGFSYLQQNAEFVDLTLAADGRLVKVHKNIVALASPYLKEMLQSASCRHPVIFLYNISYEILGYILEYIYTGEVKIPSNTIDKFFEASKALCLNGVDAVLVSENIPEPIPEPMPAPLVERIDEPAEQNKSEHITINNQENNYNLDLVSKNNVNDNVIDAEILSLPQPKLPVIDKEVAVPNNTENINIIPNSPDIDINDLLIIKPKTSAPTDKIDDSMKILGDITFNASEWQMKPSNTEMQLNVVENPDNILLDTNFTGNPEDFLMNTDHLQSNAGKTLPNIEFNDDLITTQLNEIDWQNKPIETNSNIEFNTNMINNPINITISTDGWPIITNESTPHIEFDNNGIEKPADGAVMTESSLKSTDVDVITETTLKSKRYFPIKSKQKSNKHVNRMKKLPCIRKKIENKGTLNKINKAEMDKTIHYSISERGSLQILLNCFIYRSHHHSDGGRKRRWRCTDYRKLHCQAFIDTVYEDVAAINADHAHPNHSIIIRKKIKSNVIFTSLLTALESIGQTLSDDDETEALEVPTGYNLMKNTEK